MSISPAVVPSAPSPEMERPHRIGTLSYNAGELRVLFFWLMWNDFMLMLLEQPNRFQLTLQQSNHATNVQMAVFGQISSLFIIWINPFFSTWSDRTRTRWGRRRPFLFFITPPMAVFVATMPYMPTIYYHLVRDPGWAALFAHVPMNGAAFLLGLNGFVMGFFNAMVLALFSYLYWDLVPQSVLGRFSSIQKIVLAVMGFIWNFFFFGMGEHHMKSLCVSISLVCLTAYLLSVYMVREGEYPPPDAHKKGGVVAPLRAYLVECYSNPYYLWIFASFWLFAMGGAAGNLKNHLVMFDLHLHWDTIGKLNSVPGVISIGLGFFFGSIVDRVQPVRMLAPVMVVWALTNLGSYFFVHNATSYLVWTSLSEVTTFAYGVIYGALLPEIYPMEKLGQFCSAAVLFNQGIGFVLGIPLAWLMDHMPNDQICYLWAATFQFLAAIVWVKVLLNFNIRRGRPPVPHAG